MGTEFPLPKGRGRTLSALNELIQARNLGKDACGIPLVQAAIGSVIALLTMIRASFPLFRSYEVSVDIYPGLHDEQTGLRQARAVLQSYMSNPRARFKWETAG